MPALRQWLDSETLRLESEGKSALAACFETFNEAYFRADYAQALDSIPILIELADVLDERLWQIVVRYYAASANLHWLGNLSRALDLTTEAVVESSARRMSIPGLYAHELMLYAWLETDRVGYAPAVRDVVAEMNDTALPGDLSARFRLVDAYAMSANGSSSQARQVALEALPYFDWPRPHREMLQATSLAWVGCCTEALDLYRCAADGFDREGLELDRNSAYLAAAGMLIALERFSEANSLLLDIIPPVEQSINQAHCAECHRLLAETHLGLDNADAAADSFGEALESYAGLGWRRSEAEILLRRLEVYQTLEMPVQRSEWELACEEARRVVDQLPSTDLGTWLDTIESGHAA